MHVIILLSQGVRSLVPRAGMKSQTQDRGALHPRTMPSAPGSSLFSTLSIRSLTVGTTYLEESW